MNNVKFARELVKDKIAATVFAQMLRETQDFTVLEFGYEKVVPELMQQGFADNKEVIETLRAAPDFAVINVHTKKVHLVEVKYQRQLSNDYVLQCAKRMAQSWNPSCLFICTLDGFYFDEIEKILSSGGAITSLDPTFIAADMQSRYLKILQDFEANG